MKKHIKFLFILTIIIFITGCNRDILSLKDYKEKSLDFEVESITLSKGFQNIDPQIKTTTKDDGSKLSLSLGIVDCSQIKVNKLNKKDNDINIYIERVENKDSFLSVPQVTINLTDTTVDDYDSLNYNIINENYEPIIIKFNKSDIIKKIIADFNISPINLPIANLYKEENNILWDLDFYSVINNESPSKELINLHVLVDASSGKLVESMKDSISERMFDGDLLGYIPGKSLLIKNNYSKDNVEYTELFTFNEESKEKISLINTTGDILSASFSDDGNSIAFIESLNEENTLYKTSTKDNKLEKIKYSNKMNPKLVKWNQNKLYILDNNKGEIVLYNEKNNKSKSLVKLNFNLLDFDIINDKFILLESSKEVNKNIYYKYGENKIENIGKAIKASFLNEDTIIFLRNSEKSDENILLRYDINKKEESLISDKSIRNFRIQDNNNIIYSSKDSVFNNYLVKRYNLTEDKSKSIFHMIDDNIFLNEKQNYLYLSITPTDDIDNKYIYKVYLDKLKIE